MDLIISCTFCSTLHCKPASLRQLLSTNYTNHNSTSVKCRLKTTSELQTPVGVTGGSGYQSPSIPIHKVTVRDRQRGLVHEFLVPEVLFFCYLCFFGKCSHRILIWNIKRSNWVLWISNVVEQMRFLIIFYHTYISVESILC